MTNRVALLVVMAAAIGLVLTGCGRGPGTDKMTEEPPEPPTEQPPDETMMPSIDGTWHFHGFSAEITAPAIEVTVGDGMTALGESQPYASVLKIVAKGTITAVEGTTYMLTLDEGADAISVTLSDNPLVTEADATLLIRALIKSVQDESVDITVSDNMITVTGSFLSALARALNNMPVTEVIGCKDSPCDMTAS